MHKYGAAGVPIWTRKMYMPTSNWSHFPDLSCATPFCFYTCKLHPASINFSRVIKLSAPQGSTGILKAYFSDTLIKLAYRLVKYIDLKESLSIIYWGIAWSLRTSICFKFENGKNGPCNVTPFCHHIQSLKSLGINHPFYNTYLLSVTVNCTPIQNHPPKHKRQPDLPAATKSTNQLWLNFHWLPLCHLKWPFSVSK